jgi:tRNA-Thr(GGU) m(6)t(6)A37 methyltransferase TsaA
MKTYCYTVIGTIHSDHVQADKTPIQPVFSEGCLGRAVINAELEEGLADLEGFSHLYLIYHFDRAAPAALTVKPFLEDRQHGVFATRSPRRPNPIGISIVRLIRREGNVLYLDGVDILDGTPLLDIKPYTAKFDRIDGTRNGWQDGITDEVAEQKGKRGYTGPPSPETE